MIAKDLNSYAKDRWDNYSVTITEASKISDKKGSLVLSDEKVYCFDEICKSMFDEANMPASVDGIFLFAKGNIDLIEFKTGFKKRITKYNFDREKAWCKPAGIFCKDYWDLFFKNQEKETEGLISSIRDKAIESYIALEKHVFSDCADINRKVSLKLIVVIDGDEVDAIEDAMGYSLGEENMSNSQISSIRGALKRLISKKDILGNSYFYDEIAVMTAHDFKHYVKLNYMQDKSA